MVYNVKNLSAQAITVTGNGTILTIAQSGVGGFPNPDKGDTMQLVKANGESLTLDFHGIAKSYDELYIFDNANQLLSYSAGYNVFGSNMSPGNLANIITIDKKALAVAFNPPYFASIEGTSTSVDIKNVDGSGYVISTTPLDLVVNYTSSWFITMMIWILILVIGIVIGVVVGGGVYWAYTTGKFSKIKNYYTKSV
jgi:hypothetical protein